MKTMSCLIEKNKLGNQLFVYKGLLFLDKKVIVPQGLRQMMLELVHEGHLGSLKC